MKIGTQSGILSSVHSIWLNKVTPPFVFTSAPPPIKGSQVWSHHIYPIIYTQTWWAFQGSILHASPYRSEAFNGSLTLQMLFLTIP